MATSVVLCTDGSELSIAALKDGIALLADGTTYELVTVSTAPDPAMIAGSGHAGGLLTGEEFEAQTKAAAATAEQLLNAVATALDLAGIATKVLQGEPARAICLHAEETAASAVVIGPRGHSGLKRAVLGSVSDHVVRNAPCPVIVTHPADD